VNSDVFLPEPEKVRKKVSFTAVSEPEPSADKKDAKQLVNGVRVLPATTALTGGKADAPDRIGTQVSSPSPDVAAHTGSAGKLATPEPSPHMATKRRVEPDIQTKLKEKELWFDHMVEKRKALSASLPGSTLFSAIHFAC
jgi:hypothetical protein